MHVELDDLRIFALNLRQKNQQRWMKKTVQAARAAYGNCIMLLQEAASWGPADVEGYSVYSEIGKDCAILIPHVLNRHVIAFHHSEFFSAVQIFQVMFVSLHLPHSQRPDADVYRCMSEVSALVHPWKSKHKPIVSIVLAGDFKVTLPPDCHPVTGSHVYHKPLRCKERVRRIMEWIVQFGLVALNSWKPADFAPQQSWTWSNGRGAFSQIDYICTPEEFVGKAYVETEFGIPSDHCPVIARVCAKSPIGRMTRRPAPLTGWQPACLVQMNQFKEGCGSMLSVSRFGKSPIRSLRAIEEVVFRMATDTAHTTCSRRSREFMAWPDEVRAARLAWKSEPFVERRKVLRSTFIKLRRHHLGVRCNRRLQRMCTAPSRPIVKPLSLTLADGTESSSRDAWVREASARCAAKYDEPHDDITTPHLRLDRLKSRALSSRQDGLVPPRLDLATVLQCRASLNKSTSAAADGVVNEMWQALPLLLVFCIWDLFCLRLSGNEVEPGTHWKMIDLVGIGKVKRPATLLDFRWIAKTPTFQKWYLSSVMSLIKKTAPMSRAHIYGFRTGCSTALVTELLRQCLHLSAQWGKNVYIFSLDVQTAFDDMQHEVIFQSLLSRGVHAELVYALAQEYTDLRARVTVSDSDPSASFSFLRGGRQGGVETPEVFNMVVESALEQVIEKWRALKFGFTLDDRHFTTHAVWADNFFIVAKTLDEGIAMVRDLTSAVYEKRFVWKPLSLEYICSENCEAPETLEIAVSDTTTLQLTCQERIIALGVLLDRRGSTEASLDYRFVQADKAYYKHQKTLSDPRGSLPMRLQAFRANVVQTLLYNACGWHLSKSMLERIKVWENHKLRRMFKLRRAPDEGWASFLFRTSQRIRSWYERIPCQRAHQCLLSAIHSWAGRVMAFQAPSGSQPLLELLRSRSVQVWQETRDAHAWLDRGNLSGWRHARSGPQSHWEAPLVESYGPAWWDAASNEPVWRASRQEFVRTMCDHWCLPLPSQKVASVGPHTGGASICIPQWHSADFKWDADGMCFEFRVDNRLLADWVNGQARCDERRFQPRVRQMQTCLCSLVRDHGRQLRSACSNWIRWVGREMNVVADALANEAIDRRSNVLVTGTRQVSQASYVMVSDGAARRSSNSSSASWAVLMLRDAPVELVSAGAIFLPNLVSAIEAEVLGLELSIAAFLNVSLGWTPIAPHQAECVLDSFELLRGSLQMQRIHNSLLF